MMEEAVELPVFSAYWMVLGCDENLLHLQLLEWYIMHPSLLIVVLLTVVDLYECFSLSKRVDVMVIVVMLQDLRLVVSVIKAQVVALDKKYHYLSDYFLRNPYLRQHADEWNTKYPAY